MTVIILSMVALAVVVIIALIASKGDKPVDEDPDLRPDEKKSVAATTAALSGIGVKRRREKH